MANKVHKDLTKKQEETLQFIKKYMVAHGFPPSVREICAGMGLSSPATAHTHLKELESNNIWKNIPAVKEGHVVIAYSINTMQLISVFVASNDRGQLYHCPWQDNQQLNFYLTENPDYAVKLLVCYLRLN